MQLIKLVGWFVFTITANSETNKNKVHSNNHVAKEVKHCRPRINVGTTEFQKTAQWFYFSYSPVFLTNLDHPKNWNIDKTHYLIHFSYL